MGASLAPRGGGTARRAGLASGRQGRGKRTLERPNDPAEPALTLAEH